MCGCCRFDSALPRVRPDRQTRHSGGEPAPGYDAADFDNHIPNSRSYCIKGNPSQHHWDCERYRRWDGGPGRRVGGWWGYL
jgi:hypothetical protein